MPNAKQQVATKPVSEHPVAGDPVADDRLAEGTEPISDPKRFEQSMHELETLVDRLEQGDLTLEESLAAFERGINLTRACQQALDAAEQRVRILTDRSETAEPEQYSDDVLPNAGGRSRTVHDRGSRE